MHRWFAKVFGQVAGPSKNNANKTNMVFLSSSEMVAFFLFNVRLQF